MYKEVLVDYLQNDLINIARFTTKEHKQNSVLFSYITYSQFPIKQA